MQVGNLFIRNALPVVLRCAILVGSTFCVSAEEIPQLPLAIEISSPSVPPGAMAQVRLALSTPLQISSGSLSMDFDPAIFGPLTAVDVFSATGDQVGKALITGNHVDVQFRSDSGESGGYREYPSSSSPFRCWRALQTVRQRPCVSPRTRGRGGTFSAINMLLHPPPLNSRLAADYRSIASPPVEGCSLLARRSAWPGEDLYLQPRFESTVWWWLPWPSLDRKLWMSPWELPQT